MSEMPDNNLRYQPFPEIFVERRLMTVPREAVPGSYEVWIGVIDRKSGKRVSVTSDLIEKKEAVQLPVRVTVE